jgi:hypothetical protein
MVLARSLSRMKAIHSSQPGSPKAPSASTWILFGAACSSSTWTPPKAMNASPGGSNLAISARASVSTR